VKTSQPALEVHYAAIVEFVRDNYTRKIVEVGVGHRMNVAEKLKETMPTTEVLVTDIQESVIRSYNGSTVRAIVDNVFSPRLQVYQGASLIYSLNPPIEIIPALEELAEDIGADLLVKSISDEQDIFYNRGKWKRVVRQGFVVGWLLPKDHSN
jgi:uncharacterized UPF0146 family protein